MIRREIRVSRKKTNNKWFETQDTIAYHQDFDKPKIIYPNMTKFLPFVLDKNQFYTNQKCFIITDKDDEIKLLYFLIGILNSQIAHFWIRWTCPELQGGTRELSSIYFENLPILIPDKETKAEIIGLVKKIMAKKEQHLDTAKKEEQIDFLVYQLYGLTEEIQFVEDPFNQEKNLPDPLK